MIGRIVSNPSLLATVKRLVVNNFDVWSVSKPGGVKIGPNVVDDENSGRSSGNAEMHRQIVSVKDKITAECRNLTPEEAAEIMEIVYLEFVPVTYVSPRYGQRENVLFYVQANRPKLTQPITIKGRWVPWSWEGLELTLVEK